ncbi:MAG: HPr family phosphocarrier protein [Planctomycetota bacterium]
MDTTGQDTRIEKLLVVRNKNGLHARPSSVLAEMALRFTETTLTLRKEADGASTEVDAKSIMELMLLAAGPGTELMLTASGPQAAEATDALADLFERQFDLNL